MKAVTHPARSPLTPAAPSTPSTPHSAGGVVLSSMGDRIRVVNTLEARLGLLQESMLPDIRILLFGPSPTRRFYN